MVEQETFREDLYYRIRSLQIDLPPLRERREDIPSLVLRRLGRRSGIPEATSHGLSPEFLEALMAYDWPGNVRELFHVMDRVLSAARGEPILFPKHLPAGIRTAAVKQQLRGNVPVLHDGLPLSDIINGLPPMKQHMKETRRRYVEELMRSTEGDVPTACRVSGLSRTYLYELLRKYHIKLS
jgi:two-component system NtrC family response regulator